MEAIRADVRRYTGLVVKEEWLKPSLHGRSTEAGRTLGAMLSQVADPKIAIEAGSAVAIMSPQG